MIHHPTYFVWTDPNWGWFFLGIIVGFLVHCCIARWKG